MDYNEEGIVDISDILQLRYEWSMEKGEYKPYIELVDVVFWQPGMPVTKVIWPLEKFPEQFQIWAKALVQNHANQEHQNWLAEYYDE